MKDINCLFCDIPSSNVLIEENGFTGKQCPSCNLIYISPRPTFAEIIDLYGHNDAHLSADNHITSEFSKRLHAKHTLGIISKYIKSGELLEIGSGAGFFLDESRKMGFKPHGIEFNPIQATHIREKLEIPCEEKPLGDELYNGKKFDLIYHCDVISHLYDPIVDFEKMNTLTNDGGYLIFETGNWGEIDTKYFKFIKTFMYPDHLFFFNRKNLDTLLTLTNYEMIDSYRYSQAPSLRFFYMITKLKDIIRPRKNTSSSKLPQQNSTKNSDLISKNVGQKPKAKSALLKMPILGNVWRYFRHFLRYHVGKIAPKRQRPQTMIVIARKKPSS